MELALANVFTYSQGSCFLNTNLLSVPKVSVGFETDTINFLV